MIDHADLVSERRAEFYAQGNSLALRATNPSGQNLVLDEPSVEQGRVVLVAGVTSSGGAGTRTYCFDLSRWSLAAGWPDRVYWRDRNDSLVQVRVVQEGASAREVIESCR